MALIERLLPKVVSAKTHAITDYMLVGTSFLAGALMLRRDRRAATGAFVLGTTVLANALLTDYPLGVFRLYGFRTHGALDYGIASASASMPKLLGIEDGLAKTFFRMQSAGQTMISGLTDYNSRSGAKRHRHGMRPLRRAA